MSLSNRMETRTLTVAAVAAYLGVDRVTIYTMVHRGDLPAFRVGRCYRIREEDVARYIDTHRTTPDAA